LNDDSSKDIISIIKLIIYTVIFVGVLPIYWLLGHSGIEISMAMDKVQLYYGLASFGLVGLVAGKVAQILSKNKSKSLSTLKWFGSFIHDPDDGLIANVEKAFNKKINWIRNPVRLTIISIIFFSFISLFSIISNTWFCGLPEEFQVTNTAKIGLAVNPASDAETFIFVFLVGLAFFSLRYFFLKNRYPMWAFWLIMLTIIIPILGLGGMGYHSYRYGSDIVSLLNVFIFFSLGGYLTVLFGSIIPFLVWHQANNLFQKASELFSSSTVFVFSVMILFFLLLVYMLIIRLKKQKGDK